MIDSRVRGTSLRTDDLQHLAFFGVEAVVLVPALAAPHTSPDAAIAHFGALVGAAAGRARAGGLAAGVALGLHPSTLPRDDPHLAWTRLPGLLDLPGVVAVGELGLVTGSPPELALLARQAGLAAARGLPVLLCGGGPPDLLAVALDALLAARFPVGRVLVTDTTTPEALELVQAAGALPGIPAGGDRAAQAASLALLQTLSAPTAVLHGCLGDGPADLLGLPKLCEALAAAGLPAADIARLAGGNAESFFGPRLGV